MVNLGIGYLFRKKYVTFEHKEYEIFEFVDYVVGIKYESTENRIICNIVSGNNIGVYATVLNENKNENEFVFVIDDINKAVKENDNRVNFINIRNNKIAKTAKYYIRAGAGAGLNRLVNNDLIRYMENKSKTEYDEDEFGETSNISTMYSEIKKTIVSQDEQIMQILTAIFKNQKVVNSNLDMDLISKLKENILICGPTGTGKTEILKRISKLYNIPIVIEDATSLSETGYQGRKITDMLEDLYLEAGGDIDLAQKGILVIDEFDKLAENKNDGESHVSRSGVQRSLLKLLDGSLFYFDNKKFDTTKLTIVALGAFTGITNEEDYKHLTTNDFIKYGIMSELIGRFSNIISMNSLRKEDIIKILKESDFSPLNTYKELFQLLGVDFEFNDEFIEYIASIAILKQSGARSLKTVFDDCINSALFRIFAGEYSNISMVKPNDENGKPYILTKSKNK